MPCHTVCWKFLAHTTTLLLPNFVETTPFWNTAKWYLNCDAKMVSVKWVAAVPRLPGNQNWLIKSDRYQQCLRVVASLAGSWVGRFSINSLASGRWACNLELVNFKLMSLKGSLNISCEIAVRWMHKTSLMISQWSWHHQTTSHYLNLGAWPSPKMLYGVILKDNMLMRHTVKNKLCHDTNFIITGGTASFLYDNQQCHKSWHSWVQDDYQRPVY